MKNYFLLFSIYFNCMLLISCSNINKDADCITFNKKYGDWSRDMRNKQDTILLLAKLSNLLSREQCLDAYLVRGDIYSNSMNPDNAIKDYRSVLLVDSTNTYALYKAGLAYQAGGKDDSAIYFFKKAIETKTYSNVIINKYSFQDSSGARLNMYDITYESILYAEGMSYYYLHNLESALNCFNLCINEKYMLGSSYLYRGSLYLEFKNQKNACADFVQAKMNGDPDADTYLDKYCK